MSGDLGQVSPTHMFKTGRGRQRVQLRTSENRRPPLLHLPRRAGNPTIPSREPEMVEMVENWKAHHLWEAPSWCSSCSGHADVEPH